MNNYLKEKIREKKAIICVIGLGYVGLPLAVEAAKKGFTVIGLDKDYKRVDQINSGTNYIIDVSDDELREMVLLGRLVATTDYKEINNADIIVICVPTGLNKNLCPDLGHVIAVTEGIKGNLKKDQLICIESTIFPGTTEEIVLPILESTGLKVEEDFFLCHSPERVDPGNSVYSTRCINKLVGGVGERSLDIALEFYGNVVEVVVPVSNVKTAEIAKIHENTFRAINIAAVNELAIICDKMDISIWEALDAAFTKPFGIMQFYPGPGVGGHCIPVDPHYLEYRAREYNYITKLIGVSGEVNRHMPQFVKDKTLRILNTLGKAPSESKIMVIGMAYKKDIGDYRESPAIKIADMLMSEGVEIVYYDPYVESITIDKRQLQSVSLNEDILGTVDMVIIITDHSSIDYNWLVEKSKKILDTRNATKAVPKLHKENKVVLL